jgi:hypothetical protein
MTSLLFDPLAERARFESRRAFLERFWSMAVELAPGIRLQPETAASVADQVAETLLAEGIDPLSATREDLDEAWASFGVLSPRRETKGWSLAATLMLAFPDSEREARLATLQDFPDQLLLELSDGTLEAPDVDRGSATAADRLPSVLALRWYVPDGSLPVALLADHPDVHGRFPAPPSWGDWLPAPS